MNYLLDTNVISELTKRTPNANVIHWIARHHESNLFLSVITFGELQKGISKLSDETKADQLQTWVDIDLTKRFEGRILPLSIEVLSTWGRWVGVSEKNGTKLPVMDSLIAATAMTHDLIVVTRNVFDFEHSQVRVENPWI